MHTRHLEKISGQMLDTFEGHLRHTCKVLIQQPETIVLVDLATGALMEQACTPGWNFAERLQGGKIGSVLSELSGLRAFSAICPVVLDQHEIMVMDELEKTVVRACATMLSYEKNHATWMATEPLRGYDEEHDLFAQALVAEGYEALTSVSDYYPSIGIERAVYTSKPDVIMVWNTPVYDSATRIARAFLGVARQNEAGILSDTDTEFLHDFRVSLRRVRSLLSLFRNVYGDKDCLHVKDELADIMKQTNRLRDLDVYLMDRAKFYTLVPESMHEGLNTLFDIFEQERQEVFRAVREFLQSPEYRDRMDDLQRRFSVDGMMERGVSADEASGHFARRMIMKRYNKVAKIARSIKSNTPDTTVHQLRIQCKKLRYLMEFFTPLFLQNTIKALVKSLKGLQDVLGHFNDCSVQRNSLTTFLNEHTLRGRKGMMLAESVGALVATLYQMQLRARVEIDSSLGTFVNEKTNRDFEQLFSDGASQ